MSGKKKKKSGGILFRFDMPEPFVLLIIEENGSYGFPKGKKKKNETKREAGIRETIEESGIAHLPEPKKIGKRRIHNTNIHWYLFQLFKAPMHGYAHEAIRWVSITEAKQLLGTDQVSLLQEALAMCSKD